MNLKRSSIIGHFEDLILSIAVSCIRSFLGVGAVMAEVAEIKEGAS